MKFMLRLLLVFAISSFTLTGCNRGPEEPDPVDIDIEMPDVDE
ncbi:MAG TPA: hypothetical protein PKD64_01650 [Pirellulaceae bacterium]|nr:hypothetical protein [Pirellulaceae bacterium]HMO90874.1 hypothetical protein [Pirellulaceae bacterium]HMP68650.1 hypothetical protein [Pirellulaceae bacterium]